MPRQSKLDKLYSKLVGFEQTHSGKSKFKAQIFFGGEWVDFSPRGDFSLETAMAWAAEARRHRDKSRVLEFGGAPGTAVAHDV